ncbi:acetyltransferase [Penicillium angulare]|uniref:acetyltransferase n=1 Tax=Penicillium angulare TaxID=116970 RepID=UPI002541C4DC|nr:acetyltransferase [Penicillium angulare]KAJ5279351.1 acetyltransferase [Penicillium angulare]
MIASILPIHQHDGPELARVHAAAMKTDQFWQFMLQGKPPFTHEQIMVRHIGSWIADPTARILKAVNEDGAIIAWACWLTKEKQPSPDKPESKSNFSPNDNPDISPPAIGQRMQIDSAKWQADSRLRLDDKYIVLQALATDPQYQRLGIGSKLFEEGIAKADELNMACWCQASPAGSQLYSKTGFETLGSDEYDLAEFGKYRFRYMIRPRQRENKD